MKLLSEKLSSEKLSSEKLLVRMWCLNVFLGAKETRGLKQRGPLLPFEYSQSRGYPEAGVLKKLSLAGLGKLSQLRYGLASAGYHGLGVHGRPVPANSQLIPQSMMKYLGLAA